MTEQDKLNGEYLTPTEAIQGFLTLSFTIALVIVIITLIGE